MALSLLVLLIPLILLVALFRFRGGEAVQVVDTGPAFDEASLARAFPVAIPAGLDNGWRALSATVEHHGSVVILRVGYLTPSGATAQLIESNQDAGALLADAAGTGSPVPVSIAGREWREYRGRPAGHVLVLSEPPRTVVVYGATADRELAELAGALH
jgi:Protein of unknown function (DUF4245)